jgi:hypothetical protein
VKLKKVLSTLGVLVALVGTSGFIGSGVSTAATSADTKVFLFSEIFFGGSHYGPATQAFSLGSFNDQAASLRIQADHQAFCFFADANFGGASFKTPVIDGIYEIKILGVPNPMWNKSISSFRPALPSDNC